MVLSREWLVMQGGEILEGNVKALEGSVQFGVCDNGIVQEGMHWSIGELRKNCYGTSGLQFELSFVQSEPMDSSRVRYAN